ncbi:hypothetical protein D9Q98_009493 [Chlorella vulgaris]|uniref:Methyltransferase domain-containing protein n=1 Tax=Chlorella vulgaris TaxID=3077 RepID=A0A9D4YSK7_CHLVU|nr:hypothetical protein D9Q98_009493 [Chlorella vulgaris]
MGGTADVLPPEHDSVSARLADSQCDTSVAIFKQSWSTYHKLLEVDFLEHRALYTALRAMLLASFGAHATPVAMLDLGCGDAMQIAASLRQCGAPGGELRLACYTGVDMSAPALDLAAEYLSFLKPECDVQLVEQDMKEFVAASPSQSYDLAFASFAMHHLSLDGKIEFAAQVARCLKPGGMFVLVDIFLKEGEDRVQYMKRYRTNIDEAVTRGIIEAGEAETVMAHIDEFDFPESLLEFDGLAKGAGFESADCLLTDSKEFGRLVVLRKPR